MNTVEPLPAVPGPRGPGPDMLSRSARIYQNIDTVIVTVKD
jgi:hypothetical protein